MTERASHETNDDGLTDRAAAEAAEAQMLAVDARAVVLFGTILFFAAFVGMSIFWTWLGQHGHRVWWWTALAGWMLGALAWPLIRKHTGEGRLG